MRTLNKILLAGRLGRDPEIRQPNHPGGTPWGVLSIATNRARRAPDGSWIEETDWHQVKVFGREAEYAVRVLRKGALVSVEGTVTYSKWQGADGQKHVSARILADRIGLLANPNADRAVQAQPIAVDAPPPAAFAPEVDDAPESIVIEPLDAVTAEA
jgi:single-strand DNA-binding protein